MIPEIKIPELTKAKKILAVQPHYDDNDIGAGGTLHKLSSTGAEITYLTVTDDLAGVLPTKNGHRLSKPEALQALQVNQAKAAALIGVQRQVRLELPDAGNYDYFHLRGKIIHYIREIKPDFIFSVDPWTPYEAHHDHIIAGKVCAEAAILFGLSTDGLDMHEEINDYQLEGVVFYYTAYPNLVNNISDVIEIKNQALRAYTAQFTPEGMALLIQQTTLLSEFMAREEDFVYGEALKVLHPWMLHGVPLTMML